MSKYQHIIWDWNGTLIDDLEVNIQVINTLLKRRQLPLQTLDTYYKAYEFPVEQYYRNVGFTFKDETFEEVAVEFVTEYNTRWRDCSLRTDTVEVLQAINRAGLSQWILSAAWQQVIEDGVDHFGIRQYFTKIIGLDDHTSQTKEHIGQYWIRQMQYDPKKILIIGDTVNDYDLAQAFGSDCVLITRGHNPQCALESCPAKAIIDSLSQIQKLLRRSNKTAP